MCRCACVHKQALIKCICIYIYMGEEEGQLGLKSYTSSWQASERPRREFHGLAAEKNDNLWCVKVATVVWLQTPSGVSSIKDKESIKVWMALLNLMKSIGKSVSTQQTAGKLTSFFFSWRGRLSADGCSKGQLFPLRLFGFDPSRQTLICRSAPL